MKILILGGTEESRLLADQLARLGHEVITSFAGKTTAPAETRGEIRVGGFGGAAGLSDYILKNGIQRLVDATHPYAEQMAANAVEAAKHTSIRLVRIVRPEWKEPQYAFWHRVADAAEAAAALPVGARVMLTVGQTGLDLYLKRADCSFLVRTIEPLQKPLPVHAQSILGKPPFFVGAETELMETQGVTHLITKNSGGVQTEAKLRAAQHLRVVVLMIARPVLPEAHEAPTVGRAIAALKLDAG